MAKHTIQELKQWQALPLNVKVLMTKERIRNWVNYYGEDGVYVSFSGGKDSTVLLHIAREMYPNIRGMFVDTGLEYPEIRQFVRTFDNIDITRPKMTFRQVIEKYGYPFFGKEIAETVQGARRYIAALSAAENGAHMNGKRVTGYWGMADLLGVERRTYYTNTRKVNGDGNVTPNELYEQLKYGTMSDEVRKQILNGTFDVGNGPVNRFSKTKYKFMLKAPFEISRYCCLVMKEGPSHKYNKETGRVPITAQMASESKLRTSYWIENGCNAFDLKSPISNPMAFWTEQDVLLYIKCHGIEIASVYGNIVNDTDDPDEVEGQMRFDDLDPEKFGLFDMGRPVLKTTGCERTGCMFCGFGCQQEKGEGRFERMKRTHPKQYDYIMKPWEEGGLNYKAVIDWINENGGFNIKY